MNAYGQTCILYDECVYIYTAFSTNWRQYQQWLNGNLSRYINCGLRMRREYRLRSPITVGWWSQHASRHVRDFFEGIPGTSETRNFTYLVRGPCQWRSCHVIRGNPNHRSQWVFWCILNEQSGSRKDLCHCNGSISSGYGSHRRLPFVWKWTNCGRRRLGRQQDLYLLSGHIRVMWIWGCW